MALFFFALFLTFVLIFDSTTPTASSSDSFVYGGCSQTKYADGSPYQSALNSLLASVANSAALSPYNNFSLTPPDSPGAPLSAIYQCRADLDTSSCTDCVRRCVSQLASSLCPAAAGGVLQLDGCYVKYDNVSGFVGAPDKSLMAKRCGPQSSTEYGSDMMARRDEVLDKLATEAELYREGEAAYVRGVAQCVGDLTAGECSDCVSHAGATLRGVCPGSAWGEVYLGKCYARFAAGGAQAGGWEHASTSSTNGKLPRWVFGLSLCFLIICFILPF